MKKFFIEGYGCSLNIGETEQITGFMKKHSFERTDKIEDADYLLINTCSVKLVTQQRLLSRIEKLFNKKKKESELIVTGCLAATNKREIKKISEKIIVLDTKLESLTNHLNLEKEFFSPKIIEEKSHKTISIIPISVGCLGNCAYCATKLARGELRSYSIEEINESFKRAVKESKEIWITSQDLGCYGFDIGTSLPELIKELLKNKGEFRIRLGMMNPRFFKKIKKELIPLFEDERVYNFLHLPVQSGSDKILKKMNRLSTVKDFTDAVNYARTSIPGITISTDIIVGFPGETKKDFQQSLDLIKQNKVNVLNISRFGKRKGTVADKMPGQITEWEKKERSKELSLFSRNFFAEQNKEFSGKELTALVSEEAKNGFTARTNNYRPVFVNKGFGEFVKVEIVETFAHFFKGRVIS